jgi:hypothetical protein
MKYAINLAQSSELFRKDSISEVDIAGVPTAGKLSLVENIRLTREHRDSVCQF